MFVMPEKKDIQQPEKNNIIEENEDILRQRNVDTSNPSPGSMSEGNLTNSRYDRERDSTLKDKTFITGTDDDGQAS